jgi:hypothetical protein
MSYQHLVDLLSPQQFAQLRTVREHLLQDPTALDKGKSEEASHGSEEGSSKEEA